MSTSSWITLFTWATGHLPWFFSLSVFLFIGIISHDILEDRQVLSVYRIILCNGRKLHTHTYSLYFSLCFALLVVLWDVCTLISFDTFTTAICLLVFLLVPIRSERNTTFSFASFVFLRLQLKTILIILPFSLFLSLLLLALFAQSRGKRQLCTDLSTWSVFLFLSVLSVLESPLFFAFIHSLTSLMLRHRVLLHFCC